MKFVLTQSLFPDAFEKNSKILKIVWIQTMLPKTGLSPIGTIHPLGINVMKFLGNSHELIEKEISWNYWKLLVNLLENRNNTLGVCTFQ